MDGTVPPRPPTYAVVIPTIGRGSLSSLLEALDRGTGTPPAAVIVVDDRPFPSRSLDLPRVRGLEPSVLHAGGRGPAAARNLGWRAAHTEWIAFLDDDVVPDPGWAVELAADLAWLPTTAGGSQGQVRVPLPTDRRPTDWERSVHGLERARWATADMAYRRDTLVDVGGFDERFPRAFREDADLGLRVIAAGWSISQGQRWVTHPVRPAPWWVSVRNERGNADDELMAALHGRGWRRRAAAGPGGGTGHLLTTSAAVSASWAALTGHRRTARISGGIWLTATLALIWRRVVPGPRTPREVAAMVATSLALPWAATFHRLRGKARRLSRSARGRACAPKPVLPRWPPRSPARAVLFDRDGTLVHDVPYNGDPALVRAIPGAREAVRRVRAAGLKVGVVTNQSGVARGLITPEQVDAVNERVNELVGPIDTFRACLHGPEDGCGCRKPETGLIEEAAVDLGVSAEHCAVIGDIGDDVAAATAAGSRAILVPNRDTRRAEVDAAPERATDLLAAVELVLREPGL